MCKRGWLRMVLRAGAFGLFGSILAFAGAIPIYNTGVDNFGTLLAYGASDGHYFLATSADPNFGTGPASVAFANTNFPPPPQWLPEDVYSISQWVAPRGIATQGDSSGTYDYVTTFDMTGLDPTTASLSGLWATDNLGSIFLNGVDTGQATSSFRSFTSFFITSGFTSGINTLDFRVVNTPNNGFPNPTGLRVQISGSAGVLPTPEPGSLSLLLMGLPAAGWAVWKRRTAARVR